MSSTLEQLTTPLTLDEVRASIYAVLATVGVNTTTWKPGAVVRTIITACALVIAAASRMTALIAASGFLALATGNWLILCAKYTFGVDALEASFASGTVTLTNTGGGVYGPFAADTVTFSSSVSGKSYRNTSVFSVAALETGIVVNVRAIEAGSASTVNAGDLSAIVSPAMLGVLSSNSTAIIGQDAELDQALRLRSVESLGARSPNGPADAYAYIARSAGRDANGNPIIITASNPGASIGVNRVRPVKDGVGGLDLYIATATGGVTGTPEDLTSDLGIVDDLCQRYAAPLACTLRTQSAINRSVNVSYEIWLYQTSLTDAQIVQAINDGLNAFIPLRPIGGDVINGVGAVWASALEAIIGSAQAAPSTPIGIFRTVLTTPDTVLASNEVPVLGVVTPISIHRIARAGV